MWFLEHPGHKLWKMSSQANWIHRSLGQNESLVFFGLDKGDSWEDFNDEFRVNQVGFLTLYFSR